MENGRREGYTNRNFELDSGDILQQNHRIPHVSPIGNGYADLEDVDLEPVTYGSKKSAVLVKEGHKHYGFKSGGTVVLNNFNMTVKKGTIYGLLGASGCGKTTLLSCIVGLRRLDKGEIYIHGALTGTPASGIPGKRVGYMPQEVALFGEFTIKEAMQYFGRMYGMTASEIQDKVDFLVGFLNLPPSSRKIGTLSGGQQRRVSFAVSLVHDPEILILDEPTVGVDPLLRQSIWNHLCKLVSNGTTVIITTHYIEEARQADTIGIMRSGYLMAEDSPTDLMNRYRCSLLEDIVLKLSMKDDRLLKKNAATAGISADNLEMVTFGKESNSNIKNKSSPGTEVVSISYNQWKDQSVSGEDDCIVGVKAPSKPKDKKKKPMRHKKKLPPYPQKATFMNKMNSLTIKNVLMLLRNIGFLLFVFLLPALETVVVCTAIGLDPRDIRMGVVNNEIENKDNCTIEDGCAIDGLSCRFLAELPTESVIQVPLDTEEEALKLVQEGKLWGYVVFPEGFSNAMFERGLSASALVDNETIYGARFKVQLDMSNKQVGQTMKRIFFDAFKDFVTTLMKDCGIDPTGRDLPLWFGTPIYGTDDTSFREFVAPSIALGVVFFFTLCSSGLVYITEKREGMLERTLVAGVSTLQIMLSHAITQFVVMLGQISLVFIVLFVIYQIPIRGPVVWVCALLMLVGASGMSFGFLISTVCNEEKHAIQLAMAAFFPNFVLAGMLWPIEAMPTFLRYIAYGLPCTLAGESFRSLMTRGWDITHPQVWPGFVTTIGWTALYWIITILVHILRK